MTGWEWNGDAWKGEATHGFKNLKHRGNMTETILNGLWIPLKAYMDNRLSWLEKALFAEIHRLDCGEDHCSASNQELMDKLCLSERAVQKALKNLKALGYVSFVSFNGRKRFIKSNLRTRIANKNT